MFCVYSEVDSRSYHKNIITVCLKSGHTLKISAEEAFNNDIEQGRCYWFAFDPTTKRIKSALSVEANSYELVDHQLVNLVNSANRLADTLGSIQKHERGVVLRIAGVAVTGFWSAFNAVQAFTAALAWEPDMLVVHAGLTAIGVIITKAQYEELTDAQKHAIAALKAFQAAMVEYQTIVARYKPKCLQTAIIDDPQFTKIVSILKRSVPKINVSDVRTGSVEFA